MNITNSVEIQSAAKLLKTLRYHIFYRLCCIGIFTRLALLLYNIDI